MFNIISSLLTMIQTLGTNLSNAFKCKSACCNKVYYNNSSKCAAFGNIYNKWTREFTPTVESPTHKKSQSAFFTPKNILE